jgi:kinesin family protein 5
MTVIQNNLSDNSSKKGILYLVDLAGSESVGKTGAEGNLICI